MPRLTLWPVRMAQWVHPVPALVRSLWMNNYPWGSRLRSIRLSELNGLESLSISTELSVSGGWHLHPR